MLGSYYEQRIESNSSKSTSQRHSGMPLSQSHCYRHSEGPMSFHLQDTLVIPSTGLGVAAREAVSISGDCSKNVGTVKQCCGQLSGGQGRDRDGVIHSSGQLLGSIACSDQAPIVSLAFANLSNRVLI